MSTTDRPAALRALDPLVGAWTLEARFPHPGMAQVPARATFEWAVHDRYLLQRTEVDHPDAPDALCVIALDHDGAGFTQHYFDQRGVVRLYAMTFADGHWTLTRTAPDFSPLDFSQRYLGRLDDDGRAIRGRWESSEDGGATWALDFELDHLRAG